MNGRPIPVVRPGLHAVAEIENDGSGNRWYVDPTVFERLCLQAPCVVLKEDREDAGVGVIAECGVAELGQTVPFDLGNWIADRVVIEAHHASAPISHDLSSRLWSEVEELVDQRQGLGRQVVERVVEGHHAVAELGPIGRPAVAAVMGRAHWIDEVEHLLVIALALGEFPIEVAEGVVAVAHDGLVDRAVSIEESRRLTPGVGDEVVEAVTGQEEEPMIAACRVESIERCGTWVGDVDHRNLVHSLILAYGSRRPPRAIFITDQRRRATSHQGDFMFRSSRSLVSVLAAGLLVLGACGGDDSGSSTDSDSTEESSSGSGGAAEATLAEMVGVIEGLGYDCSPESFVMTMAVRETCLSPTSAFVSAYAWADTDLFAQQVANEVRCTLDSNLGELRSLQGDMWAVTSLSLSGKPTVEYAAEIDAALGAIQEELGGTLVTTPCS